MEEGSEGQSDIPRLWPLQIQGYRRYAESRDGKLFFGWSRDGFRISNREATEPVEHVFPATESGWQDCWAFVLKTYSDLAERIRVRAATTNLSWNLMPSWRAFDNSVASSRSDSEPVIVHVGPCVLVGGYGYGNLTPGRELNLDFTEAGLRASDNATYRILLRSAYVDAIAMEFSGPGRVTRDAGIIGGGFGLKGAAEGLIVASVLNRLTRRSQIQSMIRWEARDMELFLFTSVLTPADLRVKLSSVRAKVNRETRTEAISVALESEGPPDDKLSKIERLASLYRDGLISEDEFSALKRDVFNDK